MAMLRIDADIVDAVSYGGDRYDWVRDAEVVGRTKGDTVSRMLFFETHRHVHYVRRGSSYPALIISGPGFLQNLQQSRTDKV